MIRPALAAGLVALAALPALAQAQRPAPGPYALSPDERKSLDEKKKALADRLKTIRARDASDAAVFLHTAEIADSLKLYTSKAQVANVLRTLDLGLQRCDLLVKGERPWATGPGKSLRGFVSRTDGSVQPYGVVLPSGFDPKAPGPWPLQVFLHGRGTTELSFLQSWEPAAPGKPAEQPFIELHPFGRANNGWRWAGETDIFEAIEQVRKQYPIDPDRTFLRGFSMGGHGAWHVGVHYPSLWAAVSPGAGFTETRNYIKVMPGSVPPYQEKAWHIYDAVDYALNLFNTPFIAYGGEIDPQLQASLNMKEAAAKEGLSLNVVVGPKTAHAYHPDSLKEIMRQLTEARRKPDPKQVKFTTWTVKYNRCAWVTLDALQEHYRRATVTADASGPVLKVHTDNVAALTLIPLPEGCASLEIDDQILTDGAGKPLKLERKEGKNSLSLERKEGKWAVGRVETTKGQRKIHDLQGPIDDAFTSRFLVVRGTGTAWNPATQAYCDATLKRFENEWRFGFRGELPVREDQAVTAKDWGSANLVLFGDPGSNSLIARIVELLPITWTREGIEANGRKWGPDALPVLIYPNPLNRQKYVVLNTGHTFTEKDLLASNAFLTPKLPDWAILKLGSQAPEVLAADFFDERWKVK